MDNQYKHSNQELFSNHYLEEILPYEKEWRDSEGIEEALDSISKLYKDNLTSLPNLNEAQLEDAFIKPILNLLGHYFIPQPREKTAEGIRRPDYALFDTESAKRKASTEKGKEWELFKKATGLCEAKKWNRKLDLSSLTEPDLFDFENRNPAYQMHQYLLYSEVKWGILTNGRIWRLYEREQSKKLDRFYEVDLVSLINSDGPLFAAGVSRDKQLEAFKYFYMFFRSKAFPQFLDYVLDGSVRYAEAVGAELKDNVYKALRILAQGFVEFSENELQPIRDKELIRENCFVVLYRLLFILYAEAKKLLPVSNPSYRQHYSLETIQDEVYERRGGPPYATDIPMLWDRLSALSRLINKGDKGLGIAPYNGGLFDDNQHEFFKKYKIGDRRLAEVIDLLSRSHKDESRKGFIDYSSLQIRDLGSIYEGLLENHLEVAGEPMVAVKKGKKELWKPLRERKQEEVSKTTDSVQKGEYYPVTERGDRKATGSYYTPDYIVKYIVEQTLEPLTKDVKEKELLFLRVLDPAMGSGHFLVEAADFLARKLLGVKQIEETEDEVGKAKRLIIERCIFGVDKNPLAVELAKLSLWLSTVAANKPLSFLDHHLRTGDSLIGAKVAELGTLPGEEQGSLFQSIVEHYSASTIGFYKGIEDEPSDTIDQIHEKIDLLKKARGMMKPFRQVADVWVSTYFGNEVKPADYSRLLEALRQDDKKTLAALEREKWLERANKLWERLHFFHWELEFPEVFFDKQGRPLENPGFDAVIGNPPYVSFGLRGVGKLSDDEKNYYKSIYPNSAEYKITMYPVFMQRAIDLLNNTGSTSYIVPDSFLLGQYFSKVRKYICDKCRVRQLLFIKDRVFEEGEVGISIVNVFQKENDTQERSSNLVTAIFCSNIAEFPESFAAHYRYKQSYFEGTYLNRFRLFFNKESFDFVKKIESKGFPAQQFISIHTGVRSKIGQDSICDTKHRSSTWKKGLVSGEEIGRYDLEYSGHYINIDPKLLWAGGWDEEIITSEKLLIRQTSDRLTAAFDNNKYYHLNNLHSAVLVDHDYNLFYVLGVLNSSLLDKFYRLVSLEEGRTMAQTDIETLEQLPIRAIDFLKPKDKKMHSDMVKLVQTMLDLHKRKQTVIKEYAGWLEHLTGAKLEELTGKDKIRDLEKLENVNSLADLIAKNRKLAFDTREPRSYELLSKGFEKNKNKLMPIVNEIAETDGKIDRLVYALYELTPEEIDIVEGKSKNP